MPIIILKSNINPVSINWPRPHAVWLGSMEQAREWCNKKNENPRNQRTVYEPLVVREARIDD